MKSFAQLPIHVINLWANDGNHQFTHPLVAAVPDRLSSRFEIVASVTLCQRGWLSGEAADVPVDRTPGERVACTGYPT